MVVYCETELDCASLFAMEVESDGRRGVSTRIRTAEKAIETAFADVRYWGESTVVGNRSGMPIQH